MHIDMYGCIYVDVKSIHARHYGIYIRMRMRCTNVYTDMMVANVNIYVCICTYEKNAVASVKLVN
jgi:hypothetical protein